QLPHATQATRRGLQRGEWTVNLSLRCGDRGVGDPRRAARLPAARLRLRRRRRHDARAAAVLAEPLVLHDAVDQREERVVAPHADVRSRVDPRAALPDEDVSHAHVLTGEELHAASLPRAVAAVPGAALALLVRHQLISITRTVVIACRWPRRRR